MILNIAELKTFFEAIVANQTFQNIWAWTIFIIIGAVPIFWDVIIPKITNLDRNYYNRSLSMCLQLGNYIIFVMFIKGCPSIVPNHNVVVWMKDQVIQETLIRIMCYMFFLEMFLFYFRVKEIFINRKRLRPTM